ncbi:MAG: hypothetical protein RIR18_1811 [Pseudomonadota bacterium]
MTQAIPIKQEHPFLLTLAGIQFCHVLDFMVIMPLGPILMKAFAINAHEFGLLVASYSFSAAASGLLAATFIDRFERKRLMLVMLTLFGLATLACGLSPSYSTLLISRGLAGAFGGIIGTLVHTMIGDVIPFDRRAKAHGTVSAAFSLSTIAGVPLSLWLANYFQWQAPFFLIAGLSLIFIAIGCKVLPLLHQHLSDQQQNHPFVAMFRVLKDSNHLRALLFAGLLIFSGFTVIPYITLYAVNNVGISQTQIPVVYLVGGFATFITARIIGRWADRIGKAKAYRILATLATIPLIAVTHATQLPLAGWLVFTTLFFVLISGRMIPSMAIITSAAQPQLRGTFMSINSTVQSASMGLATALSGFLITQDSTGLVVGYPTVGYIAVAANLLALWFVGRIAMHTLRPA